MTKQIAAVFLAIGAMACNGDGLIDGPVGIDGGGEPVMPAEDSAVSFPDSGIGTSDLLVSRTDPGHGPFTGGTEVIVRGTGFTPDALAWVGGLMVQPADTLLIDSTRLSIVVPANEPGPADVTVEVAGEQSTLTEGYVYDAIEVTPNRGSVSGGTVIEIIGAEGSNFASGDAVRIGVNECAVVEVVSSTRITCQTPPGVAGTVDVTVARASDGAEIIGYDAYSYYDSSDPYSGGLGGGPIAGTINLSVIDAMTNLPVDAAFAIVGQDLSTVHQGLTNILGQITFSGPDLIGSQTIHVAKFCYENTSVVTFDASDVTIFLIPWQGDPRCGEGEGELPPGRGRNGSYVSGELIWRGPNEFGPNPWNNIPPPRANETKVSYVYTTQRCAGDDLSCTNPDPALGGAIQRVLEQDPGRLGYPYRVFARPAGLAVYALAGLENSTTGEFVPYVMGVGRNVLVGPGEEATGVDMIMDIPLDHQLDVRLGGLPAAGQYGPDRFVVSADIDLGGEGLIVRRHLTGDRMDVVNRRTNESAFPFWAQPALHGALADGRYRIEALWQTGDYGAPPLSGVLRTGVRDVATEVAIEGFLGVPEAVSPADGDALPEDRVLRWSATEGGAAADLHVVLMVGGDGNPAWRHFVPGDVFEAPIPDFSTIPELQDIASGFITWAVFAIQIPGFDFNEFSYAYLNDRFWGAWALDQFTAQF